MALCKQSLHYTTWPLQVAVPEPEPVAGSPAAAEFEEEQEAEVDSSATSVLEESVRRRGRPRIHNVLDEYAPPVSPAEGEQAAQGGNTDPGPLG